MYSCKYHIVWCPKYRRSVLVNGVDKRLKEIIQQTAAEFQATMIELEIMPEHGSVVQNHHVHLLCEVSRTVSHLRRLVRYVKGRSYRLLAARVSLAALSPADSVDALYFVSSVGGAPLSIIKQYIENQKNV